MVIITFTRPEYLFLLLAIPVLIFIHIVSLKSIRRRAIKFANFEAISKIHGVEIFSKNLTVLYINTIIIILIVCSVSGMSLTKQVDASKLAFVLAIDASWSMDARDISPNRLAAAKEAGKDFLDMVPEKTKIGVVSFSGSPIVEQEVTEDKPQIKRSIDNIKLKIVGGTDILNAVVTSANLLREEEAKTIVLISDGQANINSIQDIIDYCNKNGIMVHSLGIGTREGIIEESGATFRISEDTLKTISYNTEGNYYNIKELGDFYSSLGDIISVTKKRAIYDLSLYLMIGAMILFMINFALINTRYRVLP